MAYNSMISSGLRILDTATRQTSSPAKDLIERYLYTFTVQFFCKDKVTVEGKRRGGITGAAVKTSPVKDTGPESKSYAAGYYIKASIFLTKLALG
jgi:hypothetical protein